MSSTPRVSEATGSLSSHQDSGPSDSDKERRPRRFAIYLILLVLPIHITAAALLHDFLSYTSRLLTMIGSSLHTWYFAIPWVVACAGYFAWQRAMRLSSLSLAAMSVLLTAFLCEGLYIHVSSKIARLPMERGLEPSEIEAMELSTETKLVQQQSGNEWVLLVHPSKLSDLELEYTRFRDTK